MVGHVSDERIGDRVNNYGNCRSQPGEGAGCSEDDRVDEKCGRLEDLVESSLCRTTEPKRQPCGDRDNATRLAG